VSHRSGPRLGSDRATSTASGRRHVGDICRRCGPVQRGNAQVNAGSDGTSRFNPAAGPWKTRARTAGPAQRSPHHERRGAARASISTDPLPMIERVEVLRTARRRSTAPTRRWRGQRVTRPRFVVSSLVAQQHVATRRRHEYGSSFVAGATTGTAHLHRGSAGFQGHGSCSRRSRVLDFQKSYDLRSKTERGSARWRRRRPARRTSDPARRRFTRRAVLERVQTRRPRRVHRLVARATVQRGGHNYLARRRSRYSAFATAGTSQRPPAVMVEAMYLRATAIKAVAGGSSPTADSKGQHLNPARRRRPHTGGGHRARPRQPTARRHAARFASASRSVPSIGGAERWKVRAVVQSRGLQLRASTTGQLYKPHAADSLGRA